MAKSLNLSQTKQNPAFHPLFRPNPTRPSISVPVSSRKPVKATMLSNQAYKTSIDEDIEAHLKKVIIVKEPLIVHEPFHYLTFTTPRNTAPALCVAACELVGGHRNQALPVASALHLVYASSYIHDHLPLKESCRPKPKSMINHVYGPNIELLTGDGMLPLGLELIAGSDDPAQNVSDRVLHVMVEITRAIGSLGMIHGQYHELGLVQSDADVSCHVEEIERVSEKYEGGLHSCAATCGAIIGGGSQEDIEKMRRFGLYVGKMQGVLNRMKGDGEKELEELVEEIRSLAKEELRGFVESKIEAISCFI